MTDRKLAILAIAAVIMAGWVLLQSRLAQQAGSYAVFQSTPLIQGLDIDAIAEINVRSEKGAEILTLKKQDGRFRVMEKDGYPANVSAINTLLNSCLDIRVGDRITSNPANHVDLGVTDDTAQYAVRFFNAQGGEITGILISQRQDEPEGAYARLASGNETYFVQSPPWLSATPISFINTTLVEADRGKIRQVSVRGPKGDYVLMSPDGDTVTLEAMPAGKQLKGTTFQSVFRALTSARFDDVMGADKMPADLVFDHSFVCRMEDSTVYTLMLGQKEEKYYATITAEFLDQSPVQVGRTESEEELKKKEAKLLAMDAAKEFARRHKGWVYVISSYKAGDLTKPLEDMVEDKMSEPAEAPAISTESSTEPNAI
jgi:hypothetical protein